MTDTTAPFSMSTSLLIVMSTTTTSSNAALPGFSPGRSVMVKNLDPTNDVRIAFGDSGATAAAAAGEGRGYTIMARTREAITPTGNPTHIAAVAVAGTPVLEVTVGA